MKVSGIQLFWLLFTFETGNMLLLIINPAIVEAKQDAWISSLISILLGIAIVFIAARTALFFPKHTLIDFSRFILGKWLGTIVILFYLVQWYTVIGNILSEFAGFIIIILLPRTPSWILIITMLLLMVYVTYLGGIEGIARCSEVFGPLILVMVIISILLSIPSMDFTNFLPVFVENGVRSVLSGALPPLSFLGESVIVFMMISFMDEPKQAVMKSILAIALSGFLVSLAILAVIMVLSTGVSAKLMFPFFDMVQYISIMNFIQNVEIIATIIWFLSVFIKVTVYFFAATYGTAQLFKIKSWRIVLWFVTILSFFIAINQPSITVFGIEYVLEFWAKYVLPINMVGLPLLLLIVGSIRKRFSQANKSA